VNLGIAFSFLFITAAINSSSLMSTRLVWSIPTAMGLILPAAWTERRLEHKALLRQAVFFVQKKESSDLPAYKYLRKPHHQL